MRSPPSVDPCGPVGSPRRQRAGGAADRNPHENPPAAVRALSYCEVLLLTKQAFNRIRDEYPELRDVLEKTSSERTAKLEALVLKGVVL